MHYTVREIISKSASYLAGAGLTAARLEAELLVGLVVGLDRTQLYVQYDRQIGEAELERLRPLLLARAKERIPVAYLTGHKYFLALDLVVPETVFIPRPETEELVEAVVSRLAVAHEEPLTVLDLCTGTGAIALSLAKRYSSSRITAVDLSPAAVGAAMDNARRLGLAGRVHVHQGDLWEAVPPESFDVIVSNPPYIPTTALAELPEEVRRHEPSSALDGGADGLEFYRRIMAGVYLRLKSHGLLALEHGEEQSDAIAELARQHDLVQIEQLMDLSGRPRILLARRGNGEE